MDGRDTIRWRQVAGRDPVSWLAEARTGGFPEALGAGRGGLLIIGGRWQMVGRAQMALGNRQNRSEEEKKVRCVIRCCIAFMG